MTFTMRIIVICLFALFIQQTATCQKEWSNWYTNGQHLLTFKNGYPENVTNFIPNPPTNIFHFYNWGNGGISYSDPVTGDMKFIISMRTGFGNNYNDFPTQEFIRSCPDQKSYHIIPFSNDPNKFYVIQFQSAVHDLLQQQTGLQVRCPNAIGLGYSIVDLTLNGGQGDFSSVNNVIAGGLTEQISLVKHANGQDVWIIVHPFNTAQYNAYLITAGGIQPPVISNIGVMISGSYFRAYGELAASHDGKLLAGCRSLVEQTGNQSDIELFDFNNATGVLSNYRTMSREGNISKLIFSPDNTKLYSVGYDDVYNNNIINQWDFNEFDPGASMTRLATLRNGQLTNMQLAPDGKIYLNFYREYNNDGTDITYLSAIQCPNLPKYASNFKANAFKVTFSGAALPSLVNDFLNQPPVPPTPTFNIGNDTAICFGSLTLNAPSGWQSYQWSTGETSQSITVTKAGTYYVLAGNTGFSCPEAYGYIKVSDKAIKLNLGKDTVLCPGIPYVLHVPDAYTNISWNNGSSTRDSLIYGNGTIIISALDANGCFTDDTISVGHKYYPRANFGPDTTLCNNETLLLSMEPQNNVFTPAVHQWQDNSTLDTFRVRQPGIYWGTVTFQGCTVRDTINVQYLSGETFSLGKDTTLCTGDTLTLTAPLTNAIYLWSTGETSQSIRVFNNGQYHVSVTKGQCTTRDTIIVNFQDRPVFSIGTDTALCEGSILLLQPGISGSLLWQNGSTSPDFLVNSAGIYWLKVTQNGCSATDSITVTYKNKPPLNLGSDTSFCSGGQVTFQAGNTAIQSYVWNDQSILPYFTASATGTYFVTATGHNGCINSDTVRVEVVDPPVFTLGADTAICEGKQILLSVNAQLGQFMWSNNSTGNQLLTGQAGTYWLRVSNNGCSATDTIVVSVKPNPILELGRDTTLCAGEVLTLNAFNTGASYLWHNGSTTPTFIVNKAGLHHVVVTNVNGCRRSDSINIAYLPLPVLTLGRDTIICLGQPITLLPHVNTNVAFRWQDGSSFPSFTVTDTGTYTVTVQNICGTASASVLVKKGICQLYIPNSFTPNNDNINDVFRIKYPFAVQKFNMHIYNRYGQQVFTSKDINRGWNGQYAGLPQSPGVYVWMLSFVDTDGKNKILQGTVLLIR